MLHSVGEAMLGQHIAGRRWVGPAAGRLETVSAYRMSHGDGRTLGLSSWAERDGAAAECIVLVDGTRTAIGAGGLRRQAS